MPLPQLRKVEQKKEPSAHVQLNQKIRQLHNEIRERLDQLSFYENLRQRIYGKD